MWFTAEILLDGVHQCVFEGEDRDFVITTAFEAAKVPEDIQGHLMREAGKHGNLYYVLEPEHELPYPDTQGRMWTLKLSARRYQ